MKISQDVRDYAATLNDQKVWSDEGATAPSSLTREQGLSAEAVAEAGMAQMSEKFRQMGSKVYVEADRLKGG